MTGWLQVIEASIFVLSIDWPCLMFISRFPFSHSTLLTLRNVEFLSFLKNSVFDSLVVMVGFSSGIILRRRVRRELARLAGPL